jgi:hypothetical protein
MPNINTKSTNIYVFYLYDKNLLNRKKLNSEFTSFQGSAISAFSLQEACESF